MASISTLLTNLITGPSSASLREAPDTSSSSPCSRLSCSRASSASASSSIRALLLCMRYLSSRFCSCSRGGQHALRGEAGGELQLVEPHQGGGVGHGQQQASAGGAQGQHPVLAQQLLGEPFGRGQRLRGESVEVDGGDAILPGGGNAGLARWHQPLLHHVLQQRHMRIVGGLLGLATLLGGEQAVGYQATGQPLEAGALALGGAGGVILECRVAHGARRSSNGGWAVSAF